MEKQRVLARWVGLGVAAALVAFAGIGSAGADDRPDKEARKERKHACGHKHDLGRALEKALGKLDISIGERDDDEDVVVATTEAEGLQAVADGLDALDEALRDVDVEAEVKAEIDHDLDTTEVAGEVEDAVAEGLHDAAKAVHDAVAAADVDVHVHADGDWGKAVRKALRDAHRDVKRELAKIKAGVHVEIDVDDDQ